MRVAVLTLVNDRSAKGATSYTHVEGTSCAGNGSCICSALCALSVGDTCRLHVMLLLVVKDLLLLLWMVFTTLISFRNFPGGCHFWGVELCDEASDGLLEDCTAAHS